jgi:RNase P subunit RPR2
VKKVVCPGCDRTFEVSVPIIVGLQKRHAVNVTCKHCGETFSVSAFPKTKQEKK